MRKRMLSLLVAHMLVLGMLPMGAVADEVSSASPSDEERLILDVSEIEPGESITQTPGQDESDPAVNEATSAPVDMQQTVETASEPVTESESVPEPESESESISESEKESEPTVISDDVNCDGTFDLMDVMLLSQYLVGFDVTIDETAADVDCDEKITVVDLILMKQHLAG